MATLDYEIKYGRHIAFKHKDKERFTRAKTIGEDYTEDRLKECILDNTNQRTYTVKKRVGYIIDISNNEKIKSSKGYKYWVTKHNLRTAADTVLLMREKGFKSMSQLDEHIKESALKKQNLQDKIKVIDNKISTLSNTMEHSSYHKIVSSNLSGI
jgi:relaxase